MKHYLKIYALLIILLASAIHCEKVDVPDPVEGSQTEPVFYSDMSIGNSSFMASAGKSNYVMDADFNTDPGKGTIDLIGFLRPLDCNSRPCANSIRIMLRGRYQPGNAFDIGQVLTKRDFDYAWTFDRDSALVKFSYPPTMADASTLTWKFGDENEFRNQDHFQRVLSVDQNYRVSLHSRQQGCESSQLQTVNLSTNGCRSVIRIDNDRAIVRSNGKPPFRYQWSDGSQDSVISVTAATVSNLKTLKVKVIDANQCESEASIGFGTGQSNNRYCETNFTYTKSILQARDLVHIGKVLIEYTGADGTVYRSNGYRQPKQATFRILEIADFEKNDRGHKTKKIKAEIRCLLSSQDNPEKEVELSGTCVLAIAYPD